MYNHVKGENRGVAIAVNRVLDAVVAELGVDDGRPFVYVVQLLEGLEFLLTGVLEAVKLSPVN